MPSSTECVPVRKAGSSPLPRHATAAVLTALAVLLAACGPGGPGPDQPRRVLLIVIDTLRADHLGIGGYEQAHTPTLDRLAAEGIWFSDAMTPVPVTLPAFASLLTGRLPLHHGVRDNARFTLAEEEETLAERFDRGGWRTGAVLGSAVLESDRGLAQGFEVYDDEFEGPYAVHDPAYEPFASKLATDRRRADTVTDRALELARSFGDDPWFLLVHYFDPHSYYDPPPEAAARHPGRPYDGEITFVDAQIGRLLESLGDLSDALVIVVADHGEGLGEHGELEHGFLLYQSTLHVPVIVRGKGVPVGVTRDDPISLVDLEPTLADVLTLPAARTPRDGRVLELGRTSAPARPLYAETLRPILSYSWSELRAIRDGEYKLHVGPYDELYDLSVDPSETTPLNEPDLEKRLRETLAGWTGGDDAEQVRREALDRPEPERIEALESLGYVGGGSSAARPKQRPHPKDALPEWNERQAQRARLRTALQLAEAGEPARAVAELDTFLTWYPERADGWYERALLHLELGDSAAYRDDLRRTLEADGSHAAALSRISAELIQGGEIAEAYPYLRQLVVIRPDDADAHYNLGVAARVLGRSSESTTHLQRFLELAPDDPRAARVRAALGRR